MLAAPAAAVPADASAVADAFADADVDADANSDREAGAAGAAAAAAAPAAPMLQSSTCSCKASSDILLSNRAAPSGVNMGMAMSAPGSSPQEASPAVRLHRNPPQR